MPDLVVLEVVDRLPGVLPGVANLLLRRFFCMCVKVFERERVSFFFPPSSSLLPQPELTHLTRISCTSRPAAFLNTMRSSRIASTSKTAFLPLAFAAAALALGLVVLVFAAALPFFFVAAAVVAAASPLLAAAAAAGVVAALFFWTVVFVVFFAEAAPFFAGGLPRRAAGALLFLAPLPLLAVVLLGTTALVLNLDADVDDFPPPAADAAAAAFWTSERTRAKPARAFVACSSAEASAFLAAEEAAEEMCFDLPSFSASEMRPERRVPKPETAAAAPSVEVEAGR